MKVDYDIVLGCPRSGTALLMECLKSLPNSECVTGKAIAPFSNLKGETPAMNAKLEENTEGLN